MVMVSPAMTAGRLLPASIPFRFFLTAAVFHAAGWVVLAFAAGEVAGLSGGPGPVLASLHLITVGVLAMTAMGAAFQLLPVATQAAFSRTWILRLVYWLILAGTLGLSTGMAYSSPPVMLAGAIPAVAALILFTGVVARNLMAARNLPAAGIFVWLALGCLFALLGLGALLIVDYVSPVLPDHAKSAQIHYLLGVFGFMGLLAIGFSQILIPMFVIAEPPKPGTARATACLMALGIIGGIGGIVAESLVVSGAAAALAMGGAGLHVQAMTATLQRRLRPRLDLEFILIRVSWAGLLVAILLAPIAAAESGWPQAPQALVFASLFVWLLTFLLGVLQRILPFLASMHAKPPTGLPPRSSELVNQRALRIHVAAHLLALVAAGAGIAFDVAVLVRAGAIIGAAGALAFLWFATQVVHRMRAFAAKAVTGESPARSGAST